MPTWDRIEDASSIAAEVWLSRVKDDDDWKPLRKVDCRALNSRGEKDKVYIEGGRATADVLNGTVCYNFCNLPLRQLTSATWFAREEKASKEFAIVPIAREDANVVESFYQNVVKATSSLGKGLDSIMNDERELPSDPSYKVIILKSGKGVLSLKKKQKSWFGTTYDLQRGYSEYKIDGEEEEATLGPVRHLIFVVHGIGQAFINREEVKMQNLVEEIDDARMNIQKLQIEQWKKSCEKAQKAEEPEPAAPNRIEILPIQWWDKIHNSSSSLVGSLKRSTLPNIPGLRAIANDVVFDVLTYMTPTFCETVLECVTDQLHTIYHRFHKIHPDFRDGGGKFSLIGHSLGSVIVWDLLSILKDKTEASTQVPAQKISKKDNNSRSSFRGLRLLNDRTSPGRQQAHDATGGKEAWGPSLPKVMAKRIPFVPEFTMFLGSPLGMFLTLRGAHSEFDDMLQQSVLRIYTKAAEAAAKEASLIEKNDEKKKGETKKGKKIEPAVSKEEFEVPITSPFALPSGAVYNIFHPYDPIAYRIEPLLLSQSQKTEVPPALYVTKKGQKLRLHVQAKQLGDGMGKSISNFFSNFAKNEDKDGETDDMTDLSFSSENLKQGPLEFALGGKSRRVDYCIQPGVIENEYLSALTAHSSYFVNQDVLHFIIDLTDVSIFPKK